MTDKQKDAIEKSIILLRTGQLYMHYWQPGLVCKDRNNPEWQNIVMFFWKAEEPFPKKSLPPFFDALEKKYFLFNSGDFTVKAGKAAPWFGMPGGGEKHVCAIKGEDASIPELQKLGFVTYIEQIELTDNNLDVLLDKDNYFFLIDERFTSFRNGNFYLNGQPISISDIYSIGGIHLVKEVGLE